MKIGNVGGRAVLVGERGVADLEAASGGTLPADPMDLLAGWDELVPQVRAIEPRAWTEVAPEQLLPPVPRPRQSLGIGLNYRAHARETGKDLPAIPLVFAKLPGCLVGPRASVELPSDHVDWEVELVAVVGRTARNVDRHDALDQVAGFMVGQDLSERRVQRSEGGPHLTLAKSYDTFGPCGPVLTTLDELDDPNDLAITCTINGEEVQAARTSDLIFAVPDLIAFLSARLTLFPGDLVFTGTPAGVGSARQPPRYLAPGDVVTSRIEGLGTLVNECVRPAATGPVQAGH